MLVQGPAPRTSVVTDGGIAEHYKTHRTMMCRALADLMGEGSAARCASLFAYTQDACMYMYVCVSSEHGRRLRHRGAVQDAQDHDVQRAGGPHGRGLCSQVCSFLSMCSWCMSPCEMVH